MPSDRQDDSGLPPRIGMVAGGGRFPVMVAEALSRRGVEVICAAVRGEARPELRESCHTFRYFGIGRLGRLYRFFRRHGVREVTWAGWIRQEAIFFRPWRLITLWPDWRMIRLFFFRLRSRQTNTLLRALAADFESEGFHLAHSAKYSPELLVEEGVLSHRQPSAAQLDDVRFGWKIAKRMADLDVGQSVAVSEQSTLAVEGIEVTDNNIRRAGQYCRRGGFTLVKVAKENHDMRFDVPAIGPTTVESMHRAGGAVIAVEAGKTLIIDREETVQLARRKGIVLIALNGPPADRRPSS